MNPFVTGTQAYGPVTDGSDIDIVMHMNDADAFEKYLHSLDINTYRTEAQLRVAYQGFYFDFFIGKINVIVANDDGMQWWKDRTENMRKHHVNVEDKEERIRLFNEEHSYEP